MGSESEPRTSAGKEESSGCAGISAVIFDCDGVLIDSKQANVRFYNLILREMGLPEMRPEDEEYVHSQTVTESIRYLVSDSRLDSAFHTARRISYSSVLPYIRPQQNIEAALRQLAGKGYLLAVNTNRTNTIDLILDKFGLASYFNLVVTASTVEHPKPHPESLYYILGQWSLSPRKAVFIGDTEVDSRTAMTAGVPFWAYQNQALSADCHISDHLQVVQKLEGQPAEEEDKISDAG